MRGKEGVGKYGMNAEVKEKWRGKEGVGKYGMNAEVKEKYGGKEGVGGSPRGVLREKGSCREENRDWGNNCEVGR